MKNFVSCLILSLLFSVAVFSAKTEVRPEFKKYFDEYGVAGTFVLYDASGKKFIRDDPERAKKRFIPASTFKISNSLIGLETGIIADENYVFKWNGGKRALPEWEKDLDLKAAFQASCVPCYQELARTIGARRMQRFLNKLRYGNRSISGGIDRFWLTGGLRISPDEQINFLRRLYAENLPVSRRAQRIVKKIMLRETAPGYKIYGKTGFQNERLDGAARKENFGWFVGFLERDGNVYFFATNIEGDQPREKFIAARIEITNKILRDLKLL